MRKLKQADNEISNDFVEAIKGEDGYRKVCQILNERREVYSDQQTEYILVSNLCNTGVHETDFGWGKRAWACIGDPIPTMLTGVTNRVLLMDTRAGNGLEACVTLEEQDMALFEQNTELLSFASPIHNLHE